MFYICSLRFGENCNFSDECLSDEDCNNNGKCIQEDSTTIPRYIKGYHLQNKFITNFLYRTSKKCYCQAGFYGKSCDLVSKVKEKVSSLSSYKSFDMSDNYKLYWKVLKDSSEIEVVIKSRSKTWIAIGWRPENLTKSCKSFWGVSREKTPRFRFRRDATKELDQEQVEKFTPKREFHEMDCTDIVIGVAKGPLGRVVDSYTRDRSTPLSDEMYGGGNDLTAAMAYEENDETVMVFRKPLIATHPSDHSIEEGLMHIIWAHGQNPEKYSHAPRSGIEADKPSIPDFYKEDELKYHGKIHRGDRKLQLMDSGFDNNCMFKYPPDCTDKCEYKASWQFKDEKVSFHVSSSITNKWMGIGFSSNSFMVIIENTFFKKSIFDLLFW